MAGDWDTHPSDMLMAPMIERIKQAEADLRMAGIAFAPGRIEFSTNGDRYERELREEPRFKQIPGGLEVSSENTRSMCLRHYGCGCTTVPRTSEVAERCLDHYRDALYYRNRIKSARHAAACGLPWPT